MSPCISDSRRKVVPNLSVECQYFEKYLCLDTIMYRTALIFSHAIVITPDLRCYVSNKVWKCYGPLIIPVHSARCEVCSAGGQIDLADPFVLSIGQGISPNQVKTHIQCG
jgi:hypothetical protein